MYIHLIHTLVQSSKGQVKVREDVQVIAMFVRFESSIITWSLSLFGDDTDFPSMISRISIAFDYSYICIYARDFVDDGYC